jgi:Winged helix DNA-binding domain
LSRVGLVLPCLIEVSWQQVCARRLERSFLAERAKRGAVVDVTRSVCGVHAQVQASAEQQLAARVDGLQQADVRAALWERRELVKAWTIRGTLHAHPADELAMWLAARRALARGRDGLPSWRDPAGKVHQEISSDEVAAVRAAVWDALDGRCLRRDELAEAVAGRVKAIHRERLLSGFAFFLSELCQGPPQGARITLVRPDQWVSGWKHVDGRAALADACRRYVAAYGPVGPAEFGEWFGGGALSVAECRDLFRSLAGELDEMTMDGRQVFVPKGDSDFPDSPEGVRLLPEYDVYVMGSRDRERLIPERVRALVAAHGRGRYEGPAGVRFVLVDGVAAGLWERAKRGRRLELRITLAARVARRKLDAEAERLGHLLSLIPAVTVERA